jgi:hypothetical protein
MTICELDTFSMVMGSGRGSHALAAHSFDSVLLLELAAIRPDQALQYLQTHYQHVPEETSKQAFSQVAKQLVAQAATDRADARLMLHNLRIQSNTSRLMLWETGESGHKTLHLVNSEYQTNALRTRRKYLYCGQEAAHVAEAQHGDAQAVAASSICQSCLQSARRMNDRLTIAAYQEREEERPLVERGDNYDPAQQVAFELGPVLTRLFEQGDFSPEAVQRFFPGITGELTAHGLSFLTSLMWRREVATLAYEATCDIGERSLRSALGLGRYKELQSKNGKTLAPALSTTANGWITFLMDMLEEQQAGFLTYDNAGVYYEQAINTRRYWKYK